LGAFEWGPIQGGPFYMLLFSSLFAFFLAFSRLRLTGSGLPFSGIQNCVSAVFSDAVYGGGGRDGGGK
jgi:hypothetical protein